MRDGDYNIDYNNAKGITHNLYHVLLIIFFNHSPLMSEK